MRLNNNAIPGYSIYQGGGRITLLATEFILPFSTYRYCNLFARSIRKATERCHIRNKYCCRISTPLLDPRVLNLIDVIPRAGVANSTGAEMTVQTK